jgi:hypothetical protein
MCLRVNEESLTNNLHSPCDQGFQNLAREYFFSPPLSHTALQARE